MRRPEFHPNKNWKYIENIKKIITYFRKKTALQHREPLLKSKIPPKKASRGAQEASKGPQERSRASRRSQMASQMELKSMPKSTFRPNGLSKTLPKAT